MTVYDMDPSLRWLFCLTHPDDEISTCAWIRRLVLNGNEVHLSWTHHTPVRQREARATASLLEVPESNLHFFPGVDGSVCDQLAELRPEFQAMMDHVRPHRVACGAFEQGHLDHDGTNWLVNHTFSGPVLEIPFYHTYLTRFQILNRFSDPRGQELLELEPPERRFKITIARQYPSQNIWSILLWYEAWQRSRLRPMELTRTERMRWQTWFDFEQPNHPPALAARVARSPSWHRWKRAMERVRQIGSSVSLNGPSELPATP